MIEYQIMVHFFYHAFHHMQSEVLGASSEDRGRDGSSCGILEIGVEKNSLGEKSCSVWLCIWVFPKIGVPQKM